MNIVIDLTFCTWYPKLCIRTSQVDALFLQVGIGLGVFTSQMDVHQAVSVSSTNLT